MTKPIKISEKTPLLQQQANTSRNLIVNGIDDDNSSENDQPIEWLEGINIFPDLILLEIISYLSAYDIVQVMGVNRRLRRCASDNTLWKWMYQQDFPDFRIVIRQQDWLPSYINQRKNVLAMLVPAKLPDPVTNLLKQRGSRIDLKFGKATLNEHHLMMEFNHRLAIHGFSRRQSSLNAIYRHMCLSFAKRFFDPYRAALISLLCNQVELFTKRDCTLIKIALFKADYLVKFVLYACWLGYAEILNHLIVAAKLKTSLTLQHLELATVEGHYSVVKVLLENGVRPIISPATESWCLHGAARYKDEPMYELYLSYAANPKQADKTQETAEACRNRMFGIKKIEAAPIPNRATNSMDDDGDEIAASATSSVLS